MVVVIVSVRADESFCQVCKAQKRPQIVWDVQGAQGIIKSVLLVVYTRSVWNLVCSAF